MKETEYCIGDFLYGIPSSKESEMYNPIDKRVFIYNGCVTGDGYGILIGWNDGEIKKSTGFRNFMWEVMCEKQPNKKSMILWRN